ncbi:MAG TPA: aldolase/citrate lyase family protein [Candidatus Brocadiia bacterium]|nr:aldolase/citrate lyase family protein [Candidatus Brocadiia bacterium]
MKQAELRKALHEGRRVYGTCVVSTSPQWPPMIAATGLDFVFLDTEHMPIDRAQLGWMCRAYSGAGLPPIVRIPKPDPFLACMALDGGAAGVIAPYVETVEETRQLAGAVRLRPLKGDRLQRVLCGAERLDEPTARYLSERNDANLCVVNIESVAAIERLPEIAAVPGLDALLIGPHDLSISLGIPEQYTLPEYTAAVRRIIEVGRAARVGVGFHYSFGVEICVEWARMGANFIIYSSDYFVARDGLRADIERIRAALGDDDSGRMGAEGAVVV